MNNQKVITYKHKRRPIARSGGHSNVHTQFSNPLSDDGCWAPPWNSVAVQVFPGLIRVATPSPIWAPSPSLYFLASLEPAQCRGCQTLGRALNPTAYSGDSTGDRKTDSKCLQFIILDYSFISFAYIFAFTTPLHTLSTSVLF